VLKRPGVDDFLKRLHKHYELIIYTASLSKYADPLLDWLDPKNYCGYRLFREHCTYVNGIFVKDLSRIDRDLKDTMIVDNSPTAYLFHPECAIPTVSWYSDQNDMELYQLCSILEKIAYVDDIRPYLKQFISNNTVNFTKAAKV
jgi:RNA polymerase II subunit A small phosphatase-like protein